MSCSCMCSVTIGLHTYRSTRFPNGPLLQHKTALGSITEVEAFPRVSALPRGSGHREALSAPVVHRRQLVLLYRLVPLASMPACRFSRRMILFNANCATVGIGREGAMSAWSHSRQVGRLLPSAVNRHSSAFKPPD